MLIGIARKYSELRNTRSPSAHQWWACKIVIDWEVRPNGKTLGLRSWRSHILEQFPNDLSHDMLKYMQYCPTRAVTDHCYLNWFAICLFHAHRKGLNDSSERKKLQIGNAFLRDLSHSWLFALRPICELNFRKVVSSAMCLGSLSILFNGKSVAKPPKSTNHD